MKKKEIKRLLSRFDETKMPDKHKIISECGAEYRYVYRELPERRARRRFSPAMIFVIIIMIVASIATVSANLEGVRDFMQYVEYRIRYFYGDGSYSDVVVSTQVPGDFDVGTQQGGVMPDGMLQKPDYWKDHQKDVSGYIAKVTHVQQSVGRIIVHINGGEDFKVYKNYVKLERRLRGEENGEWENIFERLLPSYNPNGITPTTGIYEGEGSFSANIENLGALLAEDQGEFEYRVTVKVCSPEGEMDEGSVSAVFLPETE